MTRRQVLVTGGRAAAGLSLWKAGCVLAASSGAGIHEARYYEKLDSRRVRCQLCPNDCVVAPGERGTCGARENQNGRYYAMSYGRVCARNVDPIEKTPVFHVRPGIRTYAIATGGCNLDCKFCQSWQMAQARPEDTRHEVLTPQQVVEAARDAGCAAVSYTYTEPVNFIEYALDVAAAARKAGLLNVCHTAAYVRPAPLAALCEAMDAINVDLKGSTPEFYRDVCRGAMEPVVQALRQIAASRTHLEITMLVLPTLNDSDESVREAAAWIARALGANTPFHLSRFFPSYRLKSLPATPVETLVRLRKVAFQAGLRYVYLGNIPGHAGESTYCPRCSEVLVSRVGYEIRALRLRRGRCPGCGLEVPGRWL